MSLALAVTRIRGSEVKCLSMPSPHSEPYIDSCMMTREGARPWQLRVVSFPRSEQAGLFHAPLPVCACFVCGSTSGTKVAVFQSFAFIIN